jgi:transcriptional regulator
MHPNAAFRMTEDAARAFVADEGFGQLFASTPQGPHAYVSPRWYGAGPDEVPTWNYVAVEVELIDPRKAAAMLDAIGGFELVPTAWRGTAKLNQNKPAAVRARVAKQLGDHPLAAWMRVS